MSDQDELTAIAPDDVLRSAVVSAEPDDDVPQRGPAILAVPPPLTDVVEFSVDPVGEPQQKKQKYFAIEEQTGRRIYVGYVAYYYSRKGIARYSGDLVYDRFQEEMRIGLWAHFIWPTVMAEGGGQHLVINTWDRAHFTWGFYQLAAHTADANLILLMRELLKLPTAKFYFPDLVLQNGKVAKLTQSGPRSLESPVWSEEHREMQIPDFMTYMNPSTTRVENAEVLNAAKFIDWALRDPEMLAATVRVSLGIMRRKIASRAATFGLIGRRPELAIWISDMFHQGRGSTKQVKAALALPTFDQQLDALSKIDTTGGQAPRLATVKSCVGKLLSEGRFNGVEFGKDKLAIQENV